MLCYEKYVQKDKRYDRIKNILAGNIYPDEYSKKLMSCMSTKQ